MCTEDEIIKRYRDSMEKYRNSLLLDPGKIFRAMTHDKLTDYQQTLAMFLFISQFYSSFGLLNRYFFKDN